jgi:hypothetical protein
MLLKFQPREYGSAQTDKRYFNWFLEKAEVNSLPRKRSVLCTGNICNLSPHIYARIVFCAPSLARYVFLNRYDTPAPHVCEAFFQKLPEQDVKNTFMLLLPGRPHVAQGKTCTRCEVEGLVRLRNLATATLLASFKPLTNEDREKFRIADKESTSLFF